MTYRSRAVPGSDVTGVTVIARVEGGVESYRTVRTAE